MVDYTKPVVEKKGCRLQINLEHQWNQVYFTTEVNDLIIQITGRNEYQYSYPYRIDSGLKEKAILEIGSGLGAFMPWLIENQVGKERTIIDIADYHLMKDMLMEALVIDIPNKIRNRIEEFIRRTDLVMNDKDTRVITSSLDDAINDHPELVGRFDLVVDNSGPILYPRSVYPNKDEESAMKEVRSLEKLFLTPEGYLMTSRDS